MPSVADEKFDRTTREVNNAPSRVYAPRRGVCTSLVGSGRNDARNDGKVREARQYQNNRQERQSHLPPSRRAGVVARQSMTSTLGGREITTIYPNNADTLREVVQLSNYPHGFSDTLVHSSAALSSVCGHDDNQGLTAERKTGRAGCASDSR